MTKTIKDWESLPVFTDWADYQTLSPEALQNLLTDWWLQTERVRAAMPQAEIIVGRSQRAKRVSLSRAHCQLVRQRLVDDPEGAGRFC